MDQATHEEILSPVVRGLRKVLATRTAAGHAIHPAFAAPAEVFSDTAVLIARIAAYGRISVLALAEYAKDTPNVENTVLRNPSVRDIWERSAGLIRQGDAEFLEYEQAHVSEHVLAQACISMWSALEAGIEDMLLAAIRCDPSMLEVEEVKKIQIPLVDYNAMSEDERIEFLIERVTERQRSKFRVGAGRFEDTLNAFKLGGPIDETARRELLALAAVRNCLVHRRGVVDRRFAKDCPTSTRPVGSRIVVTFDECRRYEFAALLYLTSVLARIDKRYGGAITELDAFEARLLSDLVNEVAAPPKPSC